MYDSHHFLVALTVVLGVAAVTTVLFQWLKQPVVLGYVLAGLIIGPHVPIPLVADPAIVTTLSELGVILLMFALGLEFRFSKLVAIGATAGITAVVDCSLMTWLGFMVGRLLGWTTLESVFTAALIAISSTSIVAKAFDEQNVRGSFRDLVVGILIVEDLIAIVLMAGLTTMSSGSGLSADAVIFTTGKLAAFLVGLVVVGMLVVPRSVRAIHKLGRPETTLIASMGICFGTALLANAFGYSVALGAFIAGALVAESGHDKAIEHLVAPVRDVFAAVFFVSVGMSIEPRLIAEHWVAIVVLSAVVIVGKIVSVSLGAFFTGNGVRTSLQAGMSLAQIGEFSFIIAGLGTTLGATRSFIYPIAVAVSALTTLTTPWLIRAAAPLASFVDDKMPHRMQTFACLYGSWIEEARRSRGGNPIRALAGLMLADVAALAIVVIGTSLALQRITELVAQRSGFDSGVARLVVVVGACVLAAPFVFGLVRVANRLALRLSDRALVRNDQGVDLAATPRSMLRVALQIALIALAGLPLVALTQPFLPGPEGAVILAAVLVGLGALFWRKATNLHGHVRAGAQVVVEALASQTATSTHVASGLDHMQALVPGLGSPVPVRLEESSLGAGRTLAELDLRGVTGATVLAIARAGGAVLTPTADETLLPGDVLTLIGSRDAIDAARALLAAPRV